ncbi:hypothetical protein [Endozoicomonas sp. SESOKO1]|uniref:hypothetical protein n=1 Tax=Endozoicomonas sp. SESOKO1 TaxID=2828742 RepID=UPI0021476192|nr:hypothetical protein [Endozoicomonas sp. SESOKO1]
MQAMNNTAWMASTSSSSTADINVNDKSANDKNVCATCRKEFDKKIFVTHQEFQSVFGKCTKCIGDWKIVFASPVTNHCTILTEDSLKAALENAAETLDFRRAKESLELSPSESVSQAVAITVLRGVLQKAIAGVEVMSDGKYRNTMKFTRCFFRHGIFSKELANMAVGICFLKNELKHAQEFNTDYGAQLEAPAFRAVLQQMALVLNTAKTSRILNIRKINMLLELAKPDDAVHTIAKDILAEVLNNGITQAEGMTYSRCIDIIRFSNLLFRHGFYDIKLANMALEFCVRTYEFDHAQRYKTTYRAKLEPPAFQTILQEMAGRLDSRQVYIIKNLLNLIMPDAAAQTIAEEFLAELLQNGLTQQAVDMNHSNYRMIMDCTHLFFRFGIVNSALVNAALRICRLMGEVNDAQKIKAKYAEFVDETDQTPDDDDFTFTEGRNHTPEVNHQSEYNRHTIPGFAEKIGYTLTDDPDKNYRCMARMVHPDKQQCSDELMKELNRLFDK